MKRALLSLLGVGLVAQFVSLRVAYPHAGTAMRIPSLLGLIAGWFVCLFTLMSIIDERNPNGHRKASEDHRGDGTVDPGPDADEYAIAKAAAAAKASLGTGAAKGSGLTVEHSDEPIRAYKYAQMLVTDDGSSVCLRAFSGELHSIEGTAVCRLAQHRIMYGTRNVHFLAPEVDCVCGFYAVKEPDASQFLQGFVELEVELFGRVIECERGYRAGKQRILRVNICSRCHGFMCDKPAVTVGFDHQAMTGVLFGRGYCSDHVMTPARCVTLAQIANRLGTEVCWKEQP